jgi:cytochrome b subunit of formate dehydrogenase
MDINVIKLLYFIFLFLITFRNNLSVICKYYSICNDFQWLTSIYNIVFGFGNIYNDVTIYNVL